MSNLHSLCKAFHPDDYHHLGDEVARVGHAKNMFTDLYNFDHEHRLWEYSICLAAAGSRKDLAGKRCLDVGGSYSILGGLLTWGGADVTVTDISDHRNQQMEMGRRGVEGPSATPGGVMRFVQDDIANWSLNKVFDLVTCVSVIEHTGDDEKFFAALLSLVAPGGVLALTTDFHPSGKAQLTAHNRCYNGPMLEKWGRSPGFEPVGSFMYEDFGGHIFGQYNFASLVLRRKK